MNPILNTSADKFPYQLLIDPPQSGAWNMGVDEALLELAASAGIATLRFYQWSEPTLSLGYFQSWQDRAQHPASRKAALVRRSSGGGAILHDRELTYSIALPATHPFSQEPQRLYGITHEVIVSVLRRSLAANGRLELFCEGNSQSLQEPFLCFQRRSPGDIVYLESTSGNFAETHKIVGSAQRRRFGAVLQHGSILLKRSPATPELPGLEDLCGTSPGPDALARELLEELPNRLKIAVFLGLLSPLLTSRATELCEKKYSLAAWTCRR